MRVGSKYYPGYVIVRVFPKHPGVSIAVREPLGTAYTGLTPSQARRLAKLLDRAADRAEAKKRKRKVK